MRTFVDPLEPRRLLAGDILFIRGANRSGGFIEATNDAQRTEQLADINNASTASGNHGWKQLADLLRANGYTVTQVAEPLEAGAPSSGQTTGRHIDFEKLNLSQYEAIVFASNNAVYDKAAIDAVENYIRQGGGALFISDGNFGSNWKDSPDSDSQFLARFGFRANQDHGTYSLRRDQGDFVAPSHPVLFGVDEIDGEGVSPLVVDNPAQFGVTHRVIVGARGTTWNNDGTNAGNGFQGDARPVNSNDSTLVLANAGVGRLAGYFDRNTFFNTNGAGTDITRFDNQQFALNLFNWVSDREPPGALSGSVTQGTPYVVKWRLNDNLDGTLERMDIRVRNRKTGANLPGRDWRLDLSEGNGFTDVTITMKPDVKPGPYQIRIEPRMFADDSGNVRRGAFRFNVTFLPLNNGSSLPGSRAALRSNPFSASRISDELFGNGRELSS